MKISLVEEMRQIDKLAAQEYGLPEVLLMENAGHRTAEVMRELLASEANLRVTVIAGSGNNGGDALAAARHLINMGVKVKLFLVGDKEHFSPATAIMYQALTKMQAEMYELTEEHDWKRLHFALKFTDGIVDGILGTGFAGELRKKTLRLIEEINAAAKPVLAIDIPSGVEADTGKITTVAVKAKQTLTLGLPKIGQLFSPGADMTGELLVDDIGIPLALLKDDSIKQTLIDDAVAASLLPPRANAVHKNSCGKILVIAGSNGMTGAAALAATTALRAGAGVVTLAVPESLQNLMAIKLTEVMTVAIPELAEKPGIIAGEAALQKLLAIAPNYDTILIGPGLGRASETMELVRLLAEQVTNELVIDADAIYAFANNTDVLSKLKQIPILTPHLGEMANLLGVSVGELRETLLPIVREAASEYQAILVVKSECTIVAYPDGNVFFTSKGNSGMATAGSGDVLAGTIAGLMKQTESAWAPLLGVYLHGLAGDIAFNAKGEGLMAGDICENIAVARQKLRSFQ